MKIKNIFFTLSFCFLYIAYLQAGLNRIGPYPDQQEIGSFILGGRGYVKVNVALGLDEEAYWNLVKDFSARLDKEYRKGRVFSFPNVIQNDRSNDQRALEDLVEAIAFDLEINHNPLENNNPVYLNPEYLLGALYESIDKELNENN